MPAQHPIYRSLVRLYPADFRRRYRDDLVSHFADMVERQGWRRAWSRTAVDLVVTIPRYRLEHVMNERRTATTLNVTIVALAWLGALGVLTGVYPAALLLVVALVVAVAQRSTLAQAIRTPDTSRRRRRLWTAAILALVFVASMLSYMRDIADDEISGSSLILHNAIGVPAMIGAIVFLIAGLLTPAASPRSGKAPRSGGSRTGHRPGPASA